MFRRWRGYLTRRGKFFPVITTQAPATPPAFPPQYLEPAARRRIYTARRRASYGFPFSQVQGPVPTLARRRTGLLAVRRGRFWAVAPPPVVAAPPAWPPSLLQRIRVRLANVRRGEFFVYPIAVQAPAAPPPFPPQMVRERVRLSWVRRGRFDEPPWPQQSAAAAPAWVPVPIRQHQQAARPVRRGRFTSVPSPVRPVPSRIVSRRPLGQAVRRGRYQPGPFVEPGRPGPLVGRIITQPRRPPARPTRRTAYAEPPWPFIPPTSGTANAAVMTVPTASPGAMATAGAFAAAGTAASAVAATGTAPTANSATGSAPTATGG